MARKSNWPAALTLFLEEKANQPFVWGENDCCMFTADWLAILLGEYPGMAKELRGTYSDALSAQKVLSSLGGVEQVVADYCAEKGFNEVPAALAQRGDIATVDTEHLGPALGVVEGSQVAYAGEQGVVRVPVSTVRKAWRIR